MKKNNALRLSLFLGLLAYAVPAHAADWTIDTAHSTVGFKIRHMMVSYTRGKFTKFSGVVKIDDKKLAGSSVTADIDLASVDTGNARRDAHLKNEDFFDVKRYPKMRFVSTKVVSKGKNKLQVQGKLSLHGQTKPVSLDVELSPPLKHPMTKKLVRGASASAKISRKAFGLTYNQALEAGGVALGDEVFIELELELHQK